MRETDKYACVFLFTFFPAIAILFGVACGKLEKFIYTKLGYKYEDLEPAKWWE